jgi:hypothetical protein
MIRGCVFWLLTCRLAFGVADAAREEAASCLARLTEIHAAVAEAERAARQTNDVARADCIRKHLVSLTGLLEVGRAARGWLESVAEQEDAEAVAEELEKIRAVCSRAEKLSQFAADCAAVSSRRTKPPRPPSPPVQSERPRAVSRLSWSDSRPAGSRGAADCLRQRELACLLAQAFHLRGSGDCEEELSRRDVEPLGGWEGAECATVDDLCVTVARALGLEVADPDDPAQYRQVLAEFGLPVDRVLPPRARTGRPPWLLDREVREFLSRGLAAPLAD